MKIKSKMMLFCAAILFGLTLSSCANNKAKGKTNPVVDRADTSESTTKLDGTYSEGLTADTDPTDTDPNDTNPTGINPTDINPTPDAPSDMNYELSEVGKYLQSKGCDRYEISEMMKIEKEDFEGTVEHVIWNNNHHFYYKHHDNGQTYANCGLYAVKRLLCALGRNNIVDKDLWYRYTDAELRDMIVKISGDEKYRDQGTMPDAVHIARLMDSLGIKPPYNGVWNLQDNFYHHMSGITITRERVWCNNKKQWVYHEKLWLPDGRLYIRYDDYQNIIFKL
jgi:hypothetical protein